MISCAATPKGKTWKYYGRWVRDGQWSERKCPKDLPFMSLDGGKIERR
ncbi:hypothetical protein [Streptomyces sp. AJS327]|nr:hypothetical protein [Streptomyces sp. AJS327]